MGLNLKLMAHKICRPPNPTHPPWHIPFPALHTHIILSQMAMKDFIITSQLFCGICLCTTYSCMCFWVLVIWLQWIHVDMLQGQFYKAGLTEHLSVLVSALSSTDAAAQVKGRLGLMGSYGRSYLASLSAGLVSVLSSLLPPYNIKGKWTPVWLSPQ